MKNHTNASDALVLFGASGDLSAKKIYPALQDMIQRGRLNCPVIGVSRTAWTQDEFRLKVQESIERHGTFDPVAFKKLVSKLTYISGDYNDMATFRQLRSELKDCKRPLFYLAIPPSIFTTVTTCLAETGCSKNARIVLEKPFGRDLKSAQELNQTLHKYFPEKDLFRIDHYLGKEPIQNLTYFRYANPHIEAIWNKNFIESVQITMAESFGIGSRGRFYEEAGAIRDVVQNHMLQVISCLAMEIPDINNGTTIRDERAKLLKSIRTVEPSDIIRGQYKGYRQEANVAPDSQVETYAAIRFDIDNERWQGVPFYVRAGKKLPVTITEVIVTLKGTHPVSKDYFRFRINPEVVIAIATNVKKPGEEFSGKQIELVACNESPEALEAYDRLLGDALLGDETLFGREDSIEAAWRIVDKILTKEAPLIYEPNSWGPEERGIRWSDPSLENICQIH